MERLKKWARQLKKQIYIVYLSSKDRRVPWYTKVVALLVAAYALSPIDLIPDFIPVLGYLDDIILIPLGVWLVMKLVPDPVLHDLKKEAEELLNERKPPNYIAGIIIVCIWLAIGIGAIYLIIENVNR